MSNSKLQLIQVVQVTKLAKYKGFIDSFTFQTTFKVIQRLGRGPRAENLPQASRAVNPALTLCIYKKPSKRIAFLKTSIFNRINSIGTFPSLGNISSVTVLRVGEGQCTVSS